MNKTRLITTLLHWVWLVKRPMTMGVRVVIEGKEEGKGATVMLVRHTYVAGWHLPGGGIETRETAEDAVKKEVIEETGITVLARPELISIHKNVSASRRDHVLLYRVRDWSLDTPFSPTHEIAEARFFSVADLPEGTTRGTRSRIGEVFMGAPPDPIW